MKITNAIPLPVSRRRARRSFTDSLCFAVAGVLRFVNRDYNDRDIRERMGELTPAERKADLARDVAHEQYHEMLHEFWGGC